MTRIARIVLVAALAPLAVATWAGEMHEKKEAQLHAMDKDGDGRLSRAEVAANERLTKHFDYIDRNGDGYLQDVEVQAQHKSNVYGGMLELTDAKFHETDTDKDGKLTPQEADKFPQLAKHFGQADDNKDGFVDIAEARAFRDAAKDRME